MTRRIRTAAAMLFPNDQPRPREVILPIEDKRPLWLRYEGEMAGLLLVVAIVAGLVLA